MKMMMRDCNRELYTHHDGMTDDRMNARQEEKEKGNERVREREKKFCFSLLGTVCLGRQTIVYVCVYVIIALFLLFCTHVHFISSA